MAFFTQAGFPFDERAHAFGKLADLGQVASLLHLVPDERELEPAIPRSQSEVNTATEPILFVDDDKNVLEGYKRLFLGEFRVSLASGGEKALAAIHLLGPFAVVISDMRMPGMNGAEFLCKVRELAPETVRMLLTGYKDVNHAIDAVNHGQIYRYLTKPCDKAELTEAIQQGLTQYRANVEAARLLREAKERKLSAIRSLEKPFLVR